MLDSRVCFNNSCAALRNSSAFLDASPSSPPPFGAVGSPVLFLFLTWLASSIAASLNAAPASPPMPLAKSSMPVVANDSKNSLVCFTLFHYRI